jgi:hypothetical protein
MKKSRLLALGLVAALIAVMVFARGPGGLPPVLAQETETPTPAPDTPTPTPVPDTPTPTPVTPSPTPTITPTATPTVATVTVTPLGGFLGCSQSTPVTITAQTAAGPVPNTTPVTVSANIGSVSPAAGTTTGGGFITTYTAPPASGGLAVITATVGGATGSTAILVGCPVAPAVLQFPNTACVGFPPSHANVTFQWQSAQGALFQFVDLSLSDHFAPGTFLGAGLSGAANQLTWNGLLPGRLHFWRVNALTPEGWVTSATGAFVPCGSPQLLAPTYTCIGGGRVTIHFRWAPSSPPAAVQWLDLTLFNNNFVFGTFLGAGPLPGTTSSLSWTGILANTPHFWRVNSLFWTWFPSPTGSFIAFCP